MKMSLTKTVVALVLTLAAQGSFAGQDLQAIDGVSVVTQNAAQPISVTMVTSYSDDYWKMSTTNNREKRHFSTYLTTAKEKYGPGGYITITREQKYNRHTGKFEDYAGNTYMELTNRSGLSLKESVISDEMFNLLLSHASVVSQKCPITFTFDRNTYKLIKINATCDYKSAF